MAARPGPPVTRLPPRADSSLAERRSSYRGEGISAQQLRDQLLQLAGGGARIPVATYRLQFNAEFTFQDARRIVPYLRALGVSDVYASPYLRARSGSTHGYDVADPNRLNPELGTEDDYAAYVESLRAHGMGQVVDVVPNHMGIGDPGNTRWLDVLENGAASVYARFFDINWHPLKAGIEDQEKLVLPVLGDQYGRVLEAGELRLEYDVASGAFWVAYWEHRYPVTPKAYGHVLQGCLEQLEDTLGRRHEHALELASILTQLRHLPGRVSVGAQEMEERNREKEIVKRRIRLLHLASAPFRAALDVALRDLNGTRGDRASFDALDQILAEQPYRLAFWRVAAEEINYRRFFDISELAAVRMEDPVVFRDTHRLLLRLVEERAIQGLRIDHPDGLLDPARYFWQLQRSCFVRLYATHPACTGLGFDRSSLEERLGDLFDRERRRNPRSPMLRPLYVVVEKILSTGEELPPAWPVHGTTGYDYLNVLNGLFVDASGARLLSAAYDRFVRREVRFKDLANSTRKMVMLISLASEVNDLAYQLKRVAALDRRFRDFTLNSLTFAVREIIAALAVYRTYIDPETGEITGTDRAQIDAAVVEAKRRNPRTDPSVFQFVRDTLLLEHVDHATDADRKEQLRFVARFQQATGPVMAKGVEDTAFYQYHRLISLNEVGGDPDHFGVSLAHFHRFNAARQKAWPAAMLSTSTHDTKRSEDVRVRIDVLSELPREWRSALTRWSRLNARKKVVADGRQAPDRNEEYLLYQTLLGAWPLGETASADATFAERIASFMLKAVREAKVNTSWINPNEAYEEAVRQFVRAILDRSPENTFLDDFVQLQARVAHFGAFNSLSQTVLKLTSPGVPDTYQGNEIWDLSLVDPDNRRPVDYESRARTLEALLAAPDLPALADDLLGHWADGRIKLWVTHRTLQLRQEQPALFGAGGSYLPLRVEGPRQVACHVCAFARVLSGGPTLIVAAPVLIAGLTRGTLAAPVGGEVWSEKGWLSLPATAPRTYRNAFTGETVEAEPRNGRPALALAELFSRFPVAALLGAAVDDSSANGRV